MDLLTPLKKYFGYSEFGPLQEQIAGFARAMVKEASISRLLLRTRRVRKKFVAGAFADDQGSTSIGRSGAASKTNCR